MRRSRRSRGRPASPPGSRHPRPSCSRYPHARRNDPADSGSCSRCVSAARPPVRPRNRPPSHRPCGTHRCCAPRPAAAHWLLARAIQSSAAASRRRPGRVDHNSSGRPRSHRVSARSAVPGLRARSAPCLYSAERRAFGEASLFSNVIVPLDAALEPRIGVVCQQRPLVRGPSQVRGLCPATGETRMLPARTPARSILPGSGGWLVPTPVPRIMLPSYRAIRPSTPFGVVPRLITPSAPTSGSAGRVAGVAYVTLTVHVPPTASGDVNEQVLPVTLYKPPKLSVSTSSVICSGAVVLVLVTVTTLMTGARGDGIVNVRV